MRQVTITKTYLEFNELNKDQKAKVLDKFRHINVDCDSWYDFIKDEFHNDLETLGFSDIDSQFTGFWSQGDGASFTAKFEVPQGGKKVLDERVKNLLNDAPYFFHNPNEYELAKKSANTELASLAQDFINMDFSEEIEGWELNVDVYRTSHQYSHENTIDCDNDDLKEVARMLSVKYYHDLQSAYEYETSDDAVIETIEANDCEFDSETLSIIPIIRGEIV